MFDFFEIRNAQRAHDEKRKALLVEAARIRYLEAIKKERERKERELGKNQVVRG